MILIVEPIIGPALVRRIVCYLEVKDDGPDQTQGQLRVSICNVIVPDVHQFHLKVCESNTGI